MQERDEKISIYTRNFSYQKEPCNYILMTVKQ